MSFSYDLVSDDDEIRRVSQIRKHLPLRGQAMFDDAEILSFRGDVADEFGADSYEATKGASKLAAASALKAIARNELHVQKVQETLALKTDGAAMTREMRLSADSLCDEVKAAKQRYLDNLALADSSAVDDGFHIVSMV